MADDKRKSRNPQLPDDDDEYLTTEQVARLLKTTVATVQRWRQSKVRQGPNYISLNCKTRLYSRAAVLAWLAEREVRPRSRGPR